MIASESEPFLKYKGVVVDCTDELSLSIMKQQETIIIAFTVVTAIITIIICVLLILFCKGFCRCGCPIRDPYDYDEDLAFI